MNATALFTIYDDDFFFFFSNSSLDKLLSVLEVTFGIKMCNKVHRLSSRMIIISERN